MHAPSNPASSRLPVAVIGAGAIGRMHIERIVRHESVRLAAIADPSEAAGDLATGLNVSWFADYRDLLEKSDARAAIVATPNATHVEIGLACVHRGLAVVVEKPIADTVEEARRLCDGAAAAGVPLLVGHHRRHNPILRKAHEMIAGGLLGQPVTVTAMATFLKPDSYFEASWRRQPGGGPVLINLIHDIDLLHYLLGPVHTVQALTSNRTRGHEVEDTAAVLLGFTSGALAALTVSDTTAAPWNWDLAAGEAAHYPRQDVNTHFISGTEASLTLPRLEVWRYRGTRGWHEPLTQERTALHQRDPYNEQLRHLRAVVDGAETPVCSGLDGLQTLTTTRAVLEAARTGTAVSLQS